MTDMNAEMNTEQLEAKITQTYMAWGEACRRYGYDSPQSEAIWKEHQTLSNRLAQIHADAWERDIMEMRGNKNG